MSDDFSFPDSVHRLAASFHMQRINPDKVRICLPRDDWFNLWSILDSKYRGLMTFDGRGQLPLEFRYNGITFAVETGCTTRKAPIS